MAMDYINTLDNRSMPYRYKSAADRKRSEITSYKKQLVQKTSTEIHIMRDVIQNRSKIQCNAVTFPEFRIHVQNISSLHLCRLLQENSLYF